MSNDTFFSSRTSERAATLTQSGWLESETLDQVRLYVGHFLAVIGSQVTAPHVPTGDVPACRAKEPRWPLPTELVSGNGFQHDEWVYDPAIAGRVLAADPAADAVRCADHLVAGRGKAFLALTDRRLAVVIDKQEVAGESGMGKLLSRFTKDDTDDDNRPVTWWQVDRHALREVRPLRYGRHHGHQRAFDGFVFTDGSVLEIRSP